MEENNRDNTPQTEHHLSAGEFIKKYAKRVWAYLKVAKMEYIVMASLFAFDQISKAIVRATMSVSQTVKVIPYVLSFTYSQNFDAAFGNSWLRDSLGTVGSRLLFSIFAVVASVVFGIILVRAKGGNKLFRVSLAMLIAGAMGNCIDRMFFAYVCDFIDLQLFTLITGGWWKYIFNVADAELVIGVILIIIYFIFMYRDKPKEAPEDVVPADGVSEVSANGADDAAIENSDGEAAASGSAASASDERPPESASEAPQAEDNAAPDGESSADAEDAETKIPSDGVKEGDDA